jgi:cellobiose-specific phosphotransferase system component IIC
MLDDILPKIFSNQWRVIIIVSAVLLIATEVGFRIGLRLFRSKDEARKAQISGVQNATLGVLGLLLGFAFAMALGL